MKTLLAFIIGFGLALASYGGSTNQTTGGLTDQIPDDLTNLITNGLTGQIPNDLTNLITSDLTGQITDGLTNQITNGSTNQTKSTDSLEMRTYKVSAGTFVAHLKHLLPPRVDESNTELLIRFFKQRHIEIKPPKRIYLDEKKNLLFALAPKEDQDMIKHAITEITYTRTHKQQNDNDL